MAKSNGWILDSYTKSSCPVIDGTVKLLSEENYTSCTKWNADLRRTLRADKPDLLLISNLDYEMAGRPLTFSHQAKVAQFQDDLRSAWAELSRDGHRVVILRDTPQMGKNVPECVAEHPEQLTVCAVDRAVALNNVGTSQVVATTTLPQVQLIDLTASICPAKRCSAIIGGVLVYRDSQHLTATYSRTLAPDLEDALRRLPNSNLR
jgi:hypothetical protein